MSTERQPERPSDEKPQVFAIQRDGATWSLNRRQVLAAGAAASAASGVAGSDATAAAEPNCDKVFAHRKPITSISISTDGKHLVSASQDGTAKLWSLQEKSFIRKLTTVSESQVKTRPFAEFASRSVVVTAMGSDLKAWHLSGESLSQARMPTPASSIAVVAARKAIASTHQQKLQLWSLPELTKEDDYEFDELTTISDVQVSADGQTYAVGDASGSVAIQNNTRRKKYDIQNKGISSLVVHPKGLLLIGGADGSIGVGTRTKMLKHSQPVNDLTCSRDGRYLFSASSDKSIGVWDLSKQKLLKKIVGHDASVLAVRASPTANVLVSASEDKTIRLWSIPDGKPIACLMDIDANTADVEGITYKRRDEVTGEMITYTLPCGSPIPAGAVCICNCVPGSWVTTRTPTVTTLHYWYPN